MPDPGSRDFQAAVQGSALSGSAPMGEEGWSSVGDARSVEEVAARAAARFGIGADDVRVERASARTIDLRELAAILGEAGVRIPEAGGFGGRVGASGPAADPDAQLEHLARERDAGRITEAEFEAQKRHLLGRRGS